MDPLLETIGFGPDTDIGALRAALRRPGGRVFGGDRSPFARRVHLTAGVEVLSTYDGQGLWPTFRRGARVEGRIAGLEYDSWGPYPLRAEIDVRERSTGGGPRRLSALAWSARREAWKVGESGSFAPAAFALDVAHCARRGPSDVVPGPRWLEPDTHAELPGTTYLAAPILDVRRLENPLTGRTFDAVAVDVLGGLSVFVSRWQLDEDACDRPRVGDWISGSFALVIERLRVAGIGV
jgi:hypothetical protein